MSRVRITTTTRNGDVVDRNTSAGDAAHQENAPFDESSNVSHVRVVDPNGRPLR